MKTSVIVTTYNSPQSLKYCLLGFSTQTNKNFEIIVADDGSTAETRELLNDPRFNSLRLRHLWQADDGFRRTLLLNRAIAVAEGDYIIFCDGDCVPRQDFVANHVKLARPKQFVSGMRLEIPMEVHHNFTDELVLSGKVFDPNFLCPQHEQLRRYRHRLTKSRTVIAVGNVLTIRHCVFHGSNSSVWRDDLVKINGFDEQFRWGSDDRDVGARLRNSGVWSRFAKYSLIQLHLGHGRPWADPATIKANRRVFKRRLWLLDRTTRVAPGIAEALDSADDMRLETIRTGPGLVSAA